MEYNEIMETIYKNNQTRIETAYRFISENYPDTELYKTRNIVNDITETVFVSNGVMIDWCRGYDYLEVFGLTDKEFEIVQAKLKQDKTIIMAILGIEEENYEDWKINELVNQFRELAKKYEPRQIWLKGDECYHRGEIIDSTEDLVVIKEN